MASFASLPRARVDPMLMLMEKVKQDTHQHKVDLGVGVYRDEQGSYYEFPAIRKPFVKLAAQFMFGHSFELERVASVQTVAGTGANRIGASFLRAHYAKGNEATKAFVGVPTWGNYLPLLAHAGISTATYRYYDESTHEVDFISILGTAKNAPLHSIFVFQGCCNNPTGADMTKEQWKALSEVIKSRSHFIFFDMAYQGLGTTKPDDGWEDAWANLHVVCASADVADLVRDVLGCLMRWEISTAPAYGARLAEIILQTPELREQWKQELSEAAARLAKNRENLYRELTTVCNTPGNWDHILQDKGLFSLLGLSERQVDMLIARYHIYLPRNGRINVAGLNDSNVHAVARGIDNVVRDCSNPLMEEI
ncbi:Aspartate aminotransferase [Aspergillus tanneri]|uniref:Aspartate aminotransferase n=1 Tax=Aspergillus tanneri TaxID=1220188 RepID=A0A5M9N4H0_9EURO|nr:Aspartate aminotransferase [Aspergillus tanneri]KAA8652630.1 Aspartate aminotransferase [Aspergillus tanneri]